MLKGVVNFLLRRLSPATKIAIIKEHIEKDFPKLSDEQKKELFDAVLKIGSAAAASYLQSLAQK